MGCWGTELTKSNDHLVGVLLCENMCVCVQTLNIIWFLEVGFFQIKHYFYNNYSKFFEYLLYPMQPDKHFSVVSQWLLLNHAFYKDYVSLPLLYRLRNISHVQDHDYRVGLKSQSF